MKLAGQIGQFRHLIRRNDDGLSYSKCRPIPTLIKNKRCYVYYNNKEL